ncbi:hypothetical protein [Telluribacter humicola]|uniref:hypothetical protein n=1 Tax=Telluribacter humicola TaxID=1720261 RepID=UPI001A970DA8|nr:hypothetical protein [Telluribacter humicola]
MKHYHTYLLVGLVLLGQFHLISCTLLREVHKSRSEADSSSVRTETSSETYDTKITRDYLYGESGSGPGIIPTSGYGFSPSGPDWPAMPTGILKVPTPYLVRETVHQKGEKESAKSETKEAETSSQQTDRDYSPQIEKAIMTFQIFLVLMALAVLLLAWTFARRR